jgi:hypothetical protein
VIKNENDISMPESVGSSENKPNTVVNERKETPPPAPKSDTPSSAASVIAANQPGLASTMKPATMPEADRDSMKADEDYFAHKGDGSTSSTKSRIMMAPKSKVAGDSNSPAGSPHRSKFMDKIKGEVKVISGKLAHNEEKVEQGRRLMGKGI